MPKLQTLKPRIQTAKGRLAVMQPGSWRTNKQTSSQRGYGYAWQKARERHLASHPLCVYCEREGRVAAATVVDHKTPHRGDMALFWDERNWQSLCVHHHSSDAQKKDNRIK
jgi:5-methylcytosine-specific restriction protein A